jgi:hypothetical protein
MAKHGDLTNSFCEHVGVSPVNYRGKVMPPGRPGRRFADGHRLYLQTSFNKQNECRKQWVWRYDLGGIDHSKGLGGYPAVSLKAARKKRDELNVLLGNGHNPVKEDKDAKRAAKLAALRTVTFAEAVEQFLAAAEKGGARATRIAQDRRAQLTHVLPMLGDYPLQEINRALIIEALRKDGLWFRPVLGMRVRTCLEKLFDWAKGNDRYAGDNPALRGPIISSLQPHGRDKHTPRHREAMPLNELGVFMAKVRAAQQACIDPWDASPFHPRISHLDRVPSRHGAPDAVARSRRLEAHRCHRRYVGLSTRAHEERP